MPHDHEYGFHGASLINREVAGFTFREIVHPAGVSVSKHSHENAHMGVILRGGFEERCEGRTLDCRPMSVSYLAPGMSHSDEFHTSVHCFVIEISAKKWASLATEIPLTQPAFQARGPLAWLTMKLYGEMRFAGDTSASALIVEGLAIEVLNGLEGAKTALSNNDRPAWLGGALEMINDRFSDPLTHAEIAREARVHPVHLATAFRRYVGCTIGEYIRRLRMERACRQLSTTNMPLVDIALDAGFCDQSHFSKTFKRFVGLSPNSFRNTLRSA